MIRRQLATVDTVTRIRRELNKLTADEKEQHQTRIDEVNEVYQLASEVRSRLLRLYGQVNNWPGTPTADQLSQMTYLEGWIRRLEPRVREIVVRPET